MEYESQPLTSWHDTSGFDSGVESLDRWLREFAAHAGAMNTARTFVWAEDDRVVAYYALSGHRITKDIVPPRVARGGPSDIPAVLLGKLALDRRLQGSGRGGDLLGDAMERILVAVEVVAARLVVVDAENEAAIGFYEHFGFVRTAPDSFRLVQKVSDIEEAWG